MRPVSVGGTPFPFDTKLLLGPVPWWAKAEPESRRNSTRCVRKLDTILTVRMEGSRYHQRLSATLSLLCFLCHLCSPVLMEELPHIHGG